jgi:hypothetical protein
MKLILSDVANFYFLLRTLVGFLPFTLLFGLLSGVQAVICLAMPFFVVSVKLIFTYIALHNYAGTGRAKNENLPAPVVWAGPGISVAAAYLPPFLGYAMNGSAFLALFTVAALMAVFSFFVCTQISRVSKYLQTASNSQ